MKRAMFFLLLFICVSASAQVKFKLGSLGTPDNSNIAGPPDIYAQLSFKDDNNNGILENRESAIVTVKLINKGKGNAHEIHVSVTEDTTSPDPNLYIQEEKVIDVLLPKQERILTFKITAGKEIQTGERKFVITGKEKEGYDMEPVYLVLNTEAFHPPILQFSGMEIIETGDDRIYAKKVDGQLQPGEQVKIRVVVQNIGYTTAKYVRFSVMSTSDDIKLQDNNGILGDIRSGEVKDLFFLISPNNRVTVAGNLPVYLTLEDQNRDAVVNDYQLPIKLNQKPPEEKIVSVEAKQIERQQVARFQFTGKKSSAVAGDIVDILDVPPAKTVDSNAIAVVIGIENYKNVVAAPYAANDAEIMKRYFENRLGIPKNRIFLYTNDEVNGFFFTKTFDPVKGLIAKYVDKGQTDVFVFYSGHGMPNKTGDQVFLFPVDGDKEFVETQGYPISEFYENLNTLGAKSVTVILDACFTGVSRGSEQIKEQNLIAAKGIKIKVTKPWMSYNNFTVINSSSGEETSLGFDDSQTGLFTYFLTAGLRGAADKNKDGVITLGELKEYVEKNVMKISQRISGIQTPEFYGDTNRVLVTY